MITRRAPRAPDRLPVSLAQPVIVLGAMKKLFKKTKTVVVETPKPLPAGTHCNIRCCK